MCLESGLNAFYNVFMFCYVHNIIFALQTWNPILPDVEISLFWAAPLDMTLWLQGGIPPYRTNIQNIAISVSQSQPCKYPSHRHNKQLQLEAPQAWQKGSWKHCLLDFKWKPDLEPCMHFLLLMLFYHRVKTRQNQCSKSDLEGILTSGMDLPCCYQHPALN